jgi:uncharacterized membrane protein
MYSVSLAIKQIAIFLLPLYLIYLWQHAPKQARWQESWLGLMIIASVPTLTALPFVIWNAEGFFKSISFSATRLGDSHISKAPSLDIYVTNVYPWIVGFRAKTLMLGLMGATYLSFLNKKVSLLVSSSITMMIFVYFNSVLFVQYFVWSVSLILLTFSEFVRPSPEIDRP